MNFEVHSRIYKFEFNAFLKNIECEKIEDFQFNIVVFISINKMKLFNL